MSYPPGVVTRTINVGDSLAVESGTGLTVRATLRSSRGLVWVATGERAVSAPEVRESAAAGDAVTFTPPVTDQAGWRDLATGAFIDVSAPGSHTHTYSIELVTFRGTRPVDSRIIGPFSLPTGDGTPVDADLLIAADTVPGLLVSVPDAWGGMVAAAQQAAQDAADVAEEAVVDYLTLNPPPAGDDGREIELQTTATHVQWRYVGDAAWTDLVSLAAITGDDGLSVELQTTATHIQWRLVGGTWANLIALSALVGPAGPPNALAIGAVTTGAPGSAAAASITGTAPSQVLNLTIPTGATGAVSAWEYYAAGRPDIVGTLDPAALAWRNAAPSGSTFYSTDGTQGAWVWRKRGATWVCVEGDTGWRKLVTWDAAGTITYGTLPAGIEPSGYAGGIEVRRTGDRVDVALKCSRLTAASSGSIATGFLCYDAFNLVPIASEDATRDFWVRANAAGVLVVGQHPSGWAATNLGGGGVYAAAVASFPARPAWPTTLPGSPA